MGNYMTLLIIILNILCASWRFLCLNHQIVVIVVNFSISAILWAACRVISVIKNELLLRGIVLIQCLVS